MHPGLDMKDKQLQYIPEEADVQYRIEDHAKRTFPKVLCDLVERCLAFEPEQRPTVAQLQDEINKIIAGDAYLQKASAGLRDEEDKEHGLSYSEPRKEYRVGLAFSSGRR